MKKDDSVGVRLAGMKIDDVFVWSVVKYVIVGFSTFGLDYFLNWFFIEVMGINYLIVGYIVAPIALLFNFVSHKFWSFRDVGSVQGKTLVQVMRYLALIGLSALMNMLLMYIFYGTLELPLLWARVVCTGVGILWTFPLQRFWVYKPSGKFL